MQQKATLGELATTYLSSLPAQRVEQGQQEVYRFARWCGWDRSLDRLSPHDVATYAEQQTNTIGASSANLDPVKSFLAYLQKAGHVRQNLAAHLKVRRTVRKGSRQEQKAQTSVVHLTEEGMRQITQELEQLKGQRSSIAEELQRARADKDFRENAPLDAARDHQARVESRIRELEAVVRASRVLDSNGQQGGQHVKLGSRVTLKEMVSGDSVRYKVVSPTEMNLRTGKLSFASPLGKALLDRCSGEEVEVQAPAGVIRYRIELIES